MCQYSKNLYLNEKRVEDNNHDFGEEGDSESSLKNLIQKRGSSNPFQGIFNRIPEGRHWRKEAAKLSTSQGSRFLRFENSFEESRLFLLHGPQVRQNGKSTSS